MYVMARIVPGHELKLCIVQINLVPRSHFNDDGGTSPRRDMPDWGLLGLRRSVGDGAAGLGTPPVQGLDRQADTPADGGPGTRHALCDQATAGPAHGGAGPGSRTARGLGGGGQRLCHSADLRIRLEEQVQSHVLAVPANECVWAGSHQVPVRDILAYLPEADWETLTCGPRVPACTTGSTACWRYRRMPSGPVRDLPGLPQQPGRLAGLLCVHGATVCLLAGDLGAGGQHALVHHKSGLRGRQAGDGAGRPSAATTANAGKPLLYNSNTKRFWKDCIYRGCWQVQCSSYT